MKRHHWLLIAIAAALVLTALSVLCLFDAAREMIHEGLTYSQWYESAIAGFFIVLQTLIGCSGAVIVFSILWFYSKRPGFDTRRVSPLKAGTCGVFALISCGLTLWAVASYRTLTEVTASGVESLAPYIRSFGISRSAVQTALEATLIFGIAWLKRKPFSIAHQR